MYQKKKTNKKNKTKQNTNFNWSSIYFRPRSDGCHGNGKKPGLARRLYESINGYHAVILLNIKTRGRYGG